MSADKPLSELSREELEQIIGGYEFITRRALDNWGALMAEWDGIPANDLKRRVNKAFAVLIVNPRPASDEIVERLAAAVARAGKDNT